MYNKAKKYINQLNTLSLNPGSMQAVRPLSVPEDALREAIVNALIHQSLRVHRPVQIIRYSNRIEIINPGFSLKPTETLGEPGSEMRNPTISTIFHDTHLAEAKGTGIATMRRLMKEASMIPPTFESDHLRNIFTTRILLHHLLPVDDIKWFADNGLSDISDNNKTALIFMREVGAIDNITYRQLTGVMAREAAKNIKQLEKLQLICRKGHSRNSYYVPTDTLNALYGISNGGTSDGNGIPGYLKERIDNFGRRVPRKVLMDTIVELCSIRPFSGEELADLLGRTDTHIRNKILPQLIEEHRIRFVYPDMVNHPDQKYTC